jgi:hypothetical protein
MVELGIDTSVFERAAALLSRPLSPTALEKEQLQKGRQPPVAEASPKPKAKAKGKAKAKAAPTVEVPTDEQPGCIAAVEPSVEAKQDGVENHEFVVNAPAYTAGDNASSILAAVGDLSDLQKDWKQKMNSPSYRKAPIPRLNRKQPKILTDEERDEKLGEIDALEQELEAAKAKAAEVTAAAQRATEWVSQRVGESEVVVGGSCEDTEPQSVEYRQLAEERVKERRRKEAQERREREKREVLEKQAKHLEAEAKAKELERITKERMQSRLREEKEKQQRETDEANKQRQLREDRAAEAEELRLQAAKRVAEREEAMRRKAQEDEALEAEERRRHEEEAEAKAEEGRERTRQRMQQRAQETRAKQLQEEEARQRRMQEEAAKATERQSQAEISRARARARAAEFRQRCREEEEERAFLQAEEAALQEEIAECELIERQRKRQWRFGEAPASQQPRGNRKSSPCGSRGEDAEVERSRPARGDLISNPDPPPVKSVSSNATAVNKAAPNRASSTEVSKAAKVPPRPPSDRSHASANPSKNAVGAVSAVPKARSKPAHQGSSNIGKARARSLSVEIPTREARSNSVEVPVREGRSNLAQVTDSGGDGPIRCTVGFFGVNDIDYLDDEDEDCDMPVVAQQQAAPVTSGNKAPVRSTSSSDSTRQRKPAPQTSQPTKVTRAYSQPPPSRPPVMPAPIMPGSRPESPATPDSTYYDVPDYRLNSPSTPVRRCDVNVAKEKVNSPLPSPGAASNRSDPMMDRQVPRQQAQPWKQKAISVQPADFYLNKLKAARGQAPANNGSSPTKKSAVPLAASEGSEAVAWDEGPKSYADMMRMRARVVEATQRQEEGAKFDRTNAVLRRVQQRAAQAPSRSAST